MKKKKVEITKLDVADLLQSEDDVRCFLQEALNENDAELWQKAIGYAARSAGMAKIADAAGLNRESLYKSLKEGAHPRFDTIMKVLNAMQLKLCIMPITKINFS